MDKIGLAVKSELEMVYDIPFQIENSNEYKDRGYRLWPENELGEFFEIKMLYRQGIRLIIEIQPQRFAAEMINDIQNANDKKIELFLRYITEMKKQKAKIEVNINGITRDDIDREMWSYQWKSFKFRVSVIPEQAEYDDYEMDMFVSWSTKVVGMMLALLNVEKQEEEKLFAEGGVSQVLVNKYERNPVNRQLCVMANGFICKICGFDFGKFYGNIGYQFIHVHHIEKISLHNEAYYIDPTTDLIPVCPNCHSMLHRTDPPMLPEELRVIIEKVKTEKEK